MSTESTSHSSLAHLASAANGQNTEEASSYCMNRYQSNNGMKCCHNHKHETSRSRSTSSATSSKPTSKLSSNLHTSSTSQSSGLDKPSGRERHKATKNGEKEKACEYKKTALEDDGGHMRLQEFPNNPVTCETTNGHGLYTDCINSNNHHEFNNKHGNQPRGHRPDQKTNNFESHGHLHRNGCSRNPDLLADDESDYTDDEDYDDYESGNESDSSERSSTTSTSTTNACGGNTTSSSSSTSSRKGSNAGQDPTGGPPVPPPLDGSGRVCDCCYCEVFGHGMPVMQQNNSRVNEVRDRLRSKLNRRKAATTGSLMNGCHSGIGNEGYVASPSYQVPLTNGSGCQNATAGNPSVANPPSCGYKQPNSPTPRKNSTTTISHDVNQQHFQFETTNGHASNGGPRDDRDLDDLLNFINGTPSSRRKGSKSKQKSQTSQTTATNTSSSIEKSDKKKDRKKKKSIEEKKSSASPVNTAILSTDANGDVDVEVDVDPHENQENTPQSPQQVEPTIVQQPQQPSPDEVFMPKDIDLDNVELDEIEKEVEAWKRICFNTRPRSDRIKLNIKDFTIRKEIFQLKT